MSTPVKVLLSPKNKDFPNVLIPKIPKSKPTQRSTNDLADRLVDKFKSPEFRPLFLRVAWRLDEGTIERHVATAFELGKNPRALFITLVKQEKSYYSD